MIEEVDTYERELAEQGILPNEPIDEGTFKRVHLKADEGDEKAMQLLSMLDTIDE